jgi:hypothetical protein
MPQQNKMEGVIKQKITADMVLDMYAEYKREKNAKKKTEIKKKLDILSKNLNHYLVIPRDFDKYYEA